MAGAGKGSLTVFVVVLTVVWVLNSAMVVLALVGSANGGTQKFKVVINSPDADSASVKLQDELTKTIEGLTVTSLRTPMETQRITNKFWACKESDEGMADDYVSQLTKFKFAAVKEQIGKDVFVARLKEEFPDAAAAEKAVKEVSQRTRLITLRVKPATKLEQVKAVVLEISVSGDDKVTSLRTMVNARGLELNPSK